MGILEDLVAGVALLFAIIFAIMSIPLAIFCGIPLAILAAVFS